MAFGKMARNIKGDIAVDMGLILVGADVLAKTPGVGPGRVANTIESRPFHG